MNDWINTEFHLLTFHPIENPGISRDRINSRQLQFDQVRSNDSWSSSNDMNDSRISTPVKSPLDHHFRLFGIHFDLFFTTLVFLRSLSIVRRDQTSLEVWNCVR
jgi:hypothetical protein